MLGEELPCTPARNLRSLVVAAVEVTIVIYNYMLGGVGFCARARARVCVNINYGPSQKHMHRLHSKHKLKTYEENTVRGLGKEANLIAISELSHAYFNALIRVSS